MTYTQEISGDAKEISGHFDDHTDVFFRLWAPIIPFLIWFNVQNFIIPGPGGGGILVYMIFKALQYYGCSALIYHWMRFCLTGEHPRTWYYPLLPTRGFLLFFGMVVLARVFIDLDKILFFALGGNHDFIGAFNTLRYGIIVVYIGIVYAVFRSCFVFPMIANGQKTDFKASWAATKGISYKVILSGVRACLPYLIAVAVLPNILGAIVRAIFQPGQEHVAAIFNMVLYLPVALLLVPIILTLSASTMAYHYREKFMNVG